MTIEAARVLESLRTVAKKAQPDVLVNTLILAVSLSLVQRQAEIYHISWATEYQEQQKYIENSIICVCVCVCVCACAHAHAYVDIRRQLLLPIAVLAFSVPLLQDLKNSYYAECRLRKSSDYSWYNYIQLERLRHHSSVCRPGPFAQTLLTVLPLTTGTKLGWAKLWQTPERLASPSPFGQDSVPISLATWTYIPQQHSRTVHCLQQAPRDSRGRSTHLKTSSAFSAIPHTLLSFPLEEFYATTGLMPFGSIALTLILFLQIFLSWG